jgi:hypothetical protein
MFLQNILMSSEEESFEDFKVGLLADLDALELVPETLWTIIRPTLYFSIPGIVGFILGYWLIIKDQATFWEYLLLVVGGFFLACGIMFTIVGLVTYPRNNSSYSFTNQGLTIKPKSAESEFVSWKDMNSLKIEGENQGYQKKMKVIIRKGREIIVIPIRGHYELSTKSRNGPVILKSIKKYYERMKVN